MRPALLASRSDNPLSLPSTAWLSSLISLLGLCHTKGKLSVEDDI